MIAPPGDEEALIQARVAVADAVIDVGDGDGFAHLSRRVAWRRPGPSTVDDALQSPRR